MDRSKQRARSRAGSTVDGPGQLAPGRVTLTERLTAGSGEPAAAERAWPAAALIDERTASSHGLVQFDPAATPDRDDPAEIHALAAEGMSGAAGPLPHLAAIQRSFGKHDVSGVLAHQGGPAADAAAAIGANAYASGDQVAFARAPDLRLAAHEAAHVVQQRGGVRLDGGVGRSGDGFERHADAVADAVVRGESAEALLDPYAHRGAAGGPAVQRDTEIDWLETLRFDASSGWARADGRPVAGRELARLRTALARRAARSGDFTDAALRAYRAHLDGNDAPLDEATWRTRHADAGAAARTPGDAPGAGVQAPGAPQARREVEIPEVPSDQAVRREGDRTYDLGHDQAGNEVQVEEVDEVRSHGGGGQRVRTEERGRRTEVVDGRAMARQLHGELTEARARAQTEADAAPEGSAQRTQLAARLRRIDQDLETLASPAADFDPATVDTIARRHGVPRVEPQYRVRTGDVTTDDRVIDADPTDGSVGRDRRTVREEHREDGTSERTTTSSSHRVDLGAGEAQRQTGTEVVETASGGEQVATRDSTTTRARAGGGRFEVGRGSTSEVEVTSPDGMSQRQASSSETTGGAIVREDEVGVRVGRSARREQATEGGSSAVENAGAVEVTDRSVGATGSHGREQRRGALSASQRVSGDGSFSIDIEPIDGTDTYRLTFTIHLGGSGSATVGAGREAERGRPRGGHGSVTARGSLQGDLTNSRVLSAAEAQAYLDAADRADAGQTVTEPAEFGRLARIRGAADNAEILAQSGAALGDPQAAAAMRNGDSITLDTQAGVGLDGEGGYGGGRGSVAVEAGGGVQWRRTVQVERITVAGQPRMRVTVTYTRSDDMHVGGTVSVPEVGAVRGRHAEQSADTDAVQFVIDPGASDYDERYRAIVQTTDRDELRGLEARYRTDVRSSRHAESAEQDDEYQLGPTSNAMAGVRSRQHGGEDIRQVMDDQGNPVALEGTVEGGNEQDVRLRVRGTNIDPGGRHEQMRAELTEDEGMNVDLTDSAQQIDPVAAVSQAAGEMSEADTQGRIARVAARSPTEHLTHALRQFEDRWGYHLDAYDLERLSERAGDRARWGHCCIVADADVLDAWRTLRTSLASPRPRASEAAIDEAAARNLARARALQTWMQNADGNGFECLEIVLRRWGESRNSGSTDERLGRGFEWPQALTATGTQYDELVEDAGGIRERLEGWLDQPDGKGEARAHFLEVGGGFDTVAAAVRGSDEFRSEARRAELLREVEQHRSDVHRHYRDFQRRWRELHPEERGADTGAVESEDIAATRASVASSSASRARGFTRALIRTLEENHRREATLIHRAEAALPSADSGPMLGSSGRAEASQICTQVHDLHRTWITQVEDLRQAYFQAGVDESEWVVSTGPDDARNYDLEPNIGWLINIYRRTSVNSADVAPFIAEWRGQARY